jgi:hypothetical protein
MPVYSAWRWSPSTARRCTRAPRSTRTSTTTRSPERSWPRRTRSTVPRMSVLASAVAMSCPRSSRPRRAGAAGCATRGAAWMSVAPPKPGRSEVAPRAAARGTAPLGGGAPGASSGERGLRGLSRAGGDEGRPPVWQAAYPLPAAGEAGGQCDGLAMVETRCIAPFPRSRASPRLGNPRQERGGHSGAVQGFSPRSGDGIEPSKRRVAPPCRF